MWSLLWYYTFLSLCRMFDSIPLVFITLCSFPCEPCLFYLQYVFYRTHTNMCRQTHQYTWKHVFIQHSVKKSKMYAVLKSNMTMFYTILYYYPVVISILFLRNIFTRLKRRVQRGGYHHEKDKIT